MSTPLPQLLAEYKQAIADNDTKKQSRIENTVIKENLNLVRKLVTKLTRRVTASMPAEDDDLIQAGCIGMLKAWKKWIPERGQFSTYAAHWIRHEVQECMSDSQPIYRPRQQGKPWQVHKKQEAVRAQYGREATADELGVTEKQIQDWRQAPVIVGSVDDAAPENVLMLSKMGSLSHSGPLQGGHDVYPDSKPNPEEQFSFAELGALLTDGMVDLDDREAFVIDGLFMEQLPYKQVAAALDVSEEQVRQIRLSALEKLRARVQTALPPVSPTRAK